MLLFVCHASEDQNDFVRPLAEALRKDYDVWYSEFVLTLGDSLRQKIDDGLRRCDFGIVVLSKSFFAKKWPQAELDGMFALETQSRKIILPIWKGVTEDDVKQYSPLLAGKVAVSASQGLPKVLEEIRLAVNVSERKRELGVLDGAAQRVKTLQHTLAERRCSENLLRSSQGVNLVLQSVQKIQDIIENTLSANTDAASPVKFGFSRPAQNVLYVRTIYGLQLCVGLRSVFANSVSDAVLDAKIFERQFDRFGDVTSDVTDLHISEFRPTFRTGDQVVWVEADGSSTYGPEELAAYLLDLFADQIEKSIESRQQ